MQSQLVDKKLAIIFEQYKDRDFAANAQKEVEDIRRKAYRVGAITTGAAFVLNEAARLTMRSRKYITKCLKLVAMFKLKAQNVVFWLMAPTFASKYYFDSSIHERIDNLWRIHINRVDKGKNKYILSMFI